MTVSAVSVGGSTHRVNVSFRALSGVLNGL
jgi:hypothetical protein